MSGCIQFFRDFSEGLVRFTQKNTQLSCGKDHVLPWRHIFFCHKKQLETLPAWYSVHPILLPQTLQHVTKVTQKWPGLLVVSKVLFSPNVKVPRCHSIVNPYSSQQENEAMWYEMPHEWNLQNTHIHALQKHTYKHFIVLACFCEASTRNA